MNGAKHAYTPPRSEGKELPLALLSAVDALAVSPQQVRFALSAQSTTAGNLARDPRPATRGSR